MTFLCRACEAQQSHEMYHNIMKFKKKSSFMSSSVSKTFILLLAGSYLSSEDDNGAFVHRKECLLPLKNGREKAVIREAIDAVYKTDRTDEWKK